MKWFVRMQKDDFDLTVPCRSEREANSFGLVMAAIGWSVVTMGWHPRFNVFEP